MATARTHADRTLTTRQQEVLAFIQERYRIAGHEPTYREIARHFDVTVRAAAQHVQALETRGRLTRRRGIVLAPEFRPPRGPTMVLEPESSTATLDVDRLLAGLREPGLIAVHAAQAQPEFAVLPGDLLIARPLAPAHAADLGAHLLTVKAGRASLRSATDRGGAGGQVLGQLVLVIRQLD